MTNRNEELLTMVTRMVALLSSVDLKAKPAEVHSVANTLGTVWGMAQNMEKMLGDLVLEDRKEAFERSEYQADIRAMQKMKRENEPERVFGVRARGEI